MDIRQIAVIHSPFREKFGIPRQSGLCEEIESTVEFLPEWRNRDSVRGLEGFDFIWLLWGFSANRARELSNWQATVRPPRLGGNSQMGVFATRSPYRPNPIGLSSVRLLEVDIEKPGGPFLKVAGADLMDGTPIYDIKPYLEYADSHTGVCCGWTAKAQERCLKVRFDVPLPEGVDVRALSKVLSLDPRPSYQDNPDKIYGMSFKDFNVKFRVQDGTLRVISFK